MSTAPTRFWDEKAEGWTRFARGLAAGLLITGCSAEEAEVRCTDEPRTCMTLVGQTQGITDGEPRLVLSFLNRCQFPVDIKICFEDERSGADCRERTAVEPLQRISEAKDEKFLGEGIRYFVRYSSEARACRFPETSRIVF